MSTIDSDPWDDVAVVDEPEGVVRDDDNVAGVAQSDGSVARSDGRWGCPDCEKTYKEKSDLNRHRRRDHGTQLAKGARTADSSPRRPKDNVGRRQRREQAIRETLDEIVQFARAATGGPAVEVSSLVDIIDRDKQKLALSISYVAEKLNPLGTLVDWTMGHGGVLTIVRGFGGVGSWVVGRWRSLLADRQAEAELPGVVYSDELPEPAAEPPPADAWVPAAAEPAFPAYPSGDTQS